MRRIGWNELGWLIWRCVGFSSVTSWLKQPLTNSVWWHLLRTDNCCSPVSLSSRSVSSRVCGCHWWLDGWWHMGRRGGGATSPGSLSQCCLSAASSLLSAFKSLPSPGDLCVAQEGKNQNTAPAVDQGWKSSWSEILRGYRIKTIIVHRERRLWEKELQRFLLIQCTLWLFIFSIFFIIILYVMGFCVCVK